MPTVEKSIEVNAPVERAFQAWTNYELFPQFMEHVKEVRRTGPDMTHWVVEAAGTRVEWDARTVAETNRRVAWTAQGESGQSGEVRFESISPTKTRVNVRIDYKLDSGTKEKAAQGTGMDDRVVKQDLESFKEMLENNRFGTLS